MEEINLKKAQKWANDPYIDQKSRQEIQDLIDNSNFKEIDERFHKELSFGTGGMRAIVGSGINRINRYTIKKASLALYNTILEFHKKKDISIVISYDSRIHSLELAKAAAEVFSAHQASTLIYSHPSPVSLCSFAIRRYNAQAGVMITASHNPPNYNGYKVFWNDGTQVIPPYDEKIIEQFELIKEFSDIPSIPFEQAEKNDLVVWLDEDIENSYYQEINKRSFYKVTDDSLKIVYTALHGCGSRFCLRALKERGFSQIFQVKEQAKPDGHFPTVKSPNPEDPKALKLAEKLMIETGADIAMGTDPDTDRLGVATLIDGQVHFLTGNQIGTLMLYYILTQRKEQKKISNDAYFIQSIVTSRLQKTIADHFKIQTLHTLTGFKWLCSLMRERKNEDFIFATEESFGYLDHPAVRDKDAVSTCALMAELTLWFKQKDMNLLEALNFIYQKFGLFKEDLVVIELEGREGKEKIDNIMQDFRENGLESLDGEKIVEIRDYNQGILGIPPSNVLAFITTGENRLYLRPSGTEPKIKFYIHLKSKDISDKKFLEEKNQRIIKFIQEKTI